MKATINSGLVVITGSLKEESKILAVINIMLKEFNSMCMVEHCGKHTGNQMVELTACYDPFECIVQTVKESYSDAKKAA